MIKYIFSLTIIFFRFSLCRTDSGGTSSAFLMVIRWKYYRTKKPVRVRLANIDAPEKKQPFGRWSATQLKDLVAWKARNRAIRADRQVWYVFSAGSIPLTAQKQIAGRSVTALPGCTRTTIMTILSRRSSVMPAP